MSALEIDEAAQRETTYAIIHKGASPDDYSQLNDPDSPISRLARARGKSELIKEGPPEASTSTESDVSGSPEYQQQRYTMEVTEGRLKAPEGYVMLFIKPEYLMFTVYDNIRIAEENKTYPVKKETLENLPTGIVKSLYANGDVKIRGEYDPEQSQFTRVSQGWEFEADFQPMKRIMEVVELTGSTASAIDYVYVAEGPEEWDIERVADMRGIGTQSVENNVNSVKDTLDSIED